MVNDRPEKFFIGVTVEEDFVECFFSRHTDESLELSRELAVVKRERRLTRYCLKLEEHRELGHVFAIAGSQTRKQTPTILAEVPTMLLPPPGDLQAASIDSLETGLTRLDIDVPAKDIVSAVREEEGAAHVKQIDYAAPSERNSPASTARPLSFNTSNTLVSIHPLDQDPPVLPFLPTRDFRSHRRPSARWAERTQSLLPRLKIMGTACQETSFCFCTVLGGRRDPYRIMDETLSGSLQLSCLPYSQSHDKWTQSRHGRKYGRMRLDPFLSTHRKIRSDHHWMV